MADIQRLFQQEQRALQDEGKEFASDFPEAARFLDRDLVEDRDPYVERLTEGFAFLTARIRESLDAEEDGLTHHLLDLLAPDLQQPLPSIEVVEFHPRTHFPSSQTIPAGSEVRTPPIPEIKIPCRFTINHDVPIQSFDVTLAKLHLAENGETPLELELTSRSTLARGLWPDRIPFYLHGDPAVVWAVRFALIRKTAKIQVFLDQNWQDTAALKFERLDQPGYASPNSVPGPFANARDFFCADDRFRFLELTGTRIARLPIGVPLRILVHFSGSLGRGLARAVQPGLFRLHTAVAVNRFSESCQALSWDHSRSEAPLLPQTGPHREILDVVSVLGLGAGKPPVRTTYHKYSSYRARTNHAHYQILRRRRRDGTISTLLSLGGFDTNQELHSQYLAIQAECSDGSIPHDHVQPSQLTIHGPGIPKELTLAGLTRPSTSFRPPPGSDPRSRLLAFAAGHFDGWLDAQRLKDGLRQIMWDPSESKRTLIEAIQDVQTENGHILDNGVAWREMRVSIRLRDTTCTPDTWDRLGVIDAFGSVLLGIARDATPIGSRTKLQLVVEPAGSVLEWKSPV